MKKSNIIVLGLILVGSFSAFCQNLTPVKDRIDYKDETVECWRVNISPDESYVKKDFKDYIKERYDVKAKSRQSYMIIDGAVISSVSMKEINLILSLEKSKNGTELKFFGNYGNVLYFSEEKLKEELDALRVILIEYMKDRLPKYHQQNLDEANKVLQGLVKAKTNYQDDINENKEKIEELSKKIEELNKQNKDLNKQMTTKKEEIRKGKQVVESKRKMLESVRDKLNRM